MNVEGITNLRQSLNSLISLYVKNNKGKLDADSLIAYAKKLENRDGISFFSVWDKILDDDNVKSNTMSSNRYFAKGNTLLFQSDSGGLIACNLDTKDIKPVSQDEILDLLDGLDNDEHDNSVDQNIFEESTLKLDNDNIRFVQYRVDNSETQDGSDKNLTISASGVRDILMGMGQKLGITDIKEFISGTDGKLTKNQIEAAKVAIKDYLINNFGGSLDAVLKNLTDTDVQDTVSGYITQIREETLNKIVDKIYDKAIAAYKDVKSTRKGDIEYDFDNIESINLDFTEESNAEIIPANVNLKSERFLKYLRKMGIDVQTSDEISMDPDGKVNLSGKREDQTPPTENGNNGVFTISAQDVSALLAKINGKNEQAQKEEISAYLKEKFGEDIPTALSNIIDETYSSSAAGYLESQRNEAFDTIALNVLEQVKKAYIDNDNATKNEVTYNIDNIVSVVLSKTNIQADFGQKVEQGDLDKQEFIDYINQEYLNIPEATSTYRIDKNSITVADDGTVSVSADEATTNHNPTLNSNTETNSLGGNQFDNVTTTTLTISGADLLDLKQQIAQAGTGRSVIQQYLRSKGLSESYLDTVLTQVQNYSGTVKTAASDGVNFTQTSYGDLAIVVGESHNVWTQPVWSGDPIGFETNNVRYDFVEDEDHDGKFDGKDELVGYDDNWADLTKYDADGDGDIEGSELDSLMMLVNDGKSAKLVSAPEAGIERIDLKSAQDRGEVDKNGNWLSKVFNIVFKGKNIEATQTFDTEEYLKKNYDKYKDLELE